MNRRAGAGTPTHRGRAGFTLIELLVVLAIVATLLSIAVPRYFRSVDRAEEETLRQTLVVLRDAIDKYRADTGGAPESLATLVEKRYIRNLPTDPITRATDTWVLVLSQDPQQPGLVDVRSGAPGSASDGRPFREF